MNRKNATDFPQELLDIYDEYVHGIIDRRLFFSKAAKFAVAGVTVAALVNSLSPHYAWAEQVSQSDSRLKTEYASYDSPDGHGKMRGYLARPANLKGALPGVIVVHENRGLNPYVEDVARRAAVAGFVAFAPDALTPLGGYPGNDDEGRTMQRKLDGSKIVEDFVAATHFLHKHDACNKSIGVVGFCFGGGMSNTLAVRLPNIIKASAPFYGGQPSSEDTKKIKASMLLHYAELDKRVNAGWPDYETALKANGINYTAHIYPNTNHGFHNDTTPRYDEAAAKLAEKRTFEFFEKAL
jgi:carboxymethylenebutenolidase